MGRDFRARGKCGDAGNSGQSVGKLSEGLTVHLAPGLRVAMIDQLHRRRQDACCIELRIGQLAASSSLYPSFVDRHVGAPTVSLAERKQCSCDHSRSPLAFLFGEDGAGQADEPTEERCRDVDPRPRPRPP